MNGLFEELKHRNVFRVGLAYLALAWLIIQITSIAVPALNLPITLNSIVFYLGLIGFPFALLFAWAFELTPDGVKRSADVAQDMSIRSDTGRKLNYVVIGMLVFIAAMTLWQGQFTPSAKSEESKTATIHVDDSSAKTIPFPVNISDENTQKQHSIAVLPFANMSDDKDYFADGLSEELLNLLAKIDDLRVTGRTSSFAFKGRNEDLREIGKKLNVKTVLEGSVRRSGNRLRITAQLIKVEDGFHLWSETYDREMADIFAIQDEIAAKIVAALHIELEISVPVRGLPTTNMKAYDLYLLGRHEWNQRTAESIERSRDYFRQALELDPDFVKALSGLADAYIALTAYGNIRGETAYPLAEELIHRAMALDDADSEVWASLGELRGSQWEFDKAETAFKRSLALNDQNASAWLWYGNLLKRWQGDRFDESMAAYQKAYILEPMSKPLNLAMSNSYWAQGNFKLAIQHSQRVIALDPTNSKQHQFYIQLMQYWAGNLAETIFELRELLAADPSSVLPMDVLVDSNQLLGNTAEARLWAERYDALVPTGSMVARVQRHEQDYSGALVTLENSLSVAESRDDLDTVIRLFITSYEARDIPKSRQYLAEYLGHVNNEVKVPVYALFSKLELIIADFWLKFGNMDEKKRAQEIIEEVRAQLTRYVEKGYHHPLTLLPLAVSSSLLGNNGDALLFLDQAIDSGLRDLSIFSTLKGVDSFLNSREFALREERIAVLIADQKRQLDQMQLASYVPFNPPDTIEVAPERLALYVGYYSNRYEIFQFYIDKSSQFSLRLGQRFDSKLFAYNLTEFYPAKDAAMKYEFILDKTGLVNHVIWFIDGREVFLKPVPPPPPSVPVARLILEQYIGHYSYTSSKSNSDATNSTAWGLEVSVDDSGAVWWDLDDRPRMEIKPYSDTEFHIPGHDAKIRFHMDPVNGAINRTVMNRDGTEFDFVRVQRSQ